MTPKTSIEYQKLTKHFLTTRLVHPLNITTLESALLNAALDYRPAYWRRLKRAIHYTLELYGRHKAADAISKLTNPVTIKNSPLNSLKKPKQKRVKRVTTSEHHKLMAHFNSKCDPQMLGALEILRILGCRPAELANLTLLGDQTVHVEGVKKTQDGQRGLDRTLFLDKEAYDQLVNAFRLLNSHSVDDISKVVKRLQRRLQTATKALWPRRKQHITFYSYRHQLGSDLKSSGLPATTIAAVMGHQSTVSVGTYGDSRSGSLRLLPTPTEETINKVRTPTSRQSGPRPYG